MGVAGDRLATVDYGDELALITVGENVEPFSIHGNGFFLLRIAFMNKMPAPITQPKPITA
jgi:hypothetical protein